MKRFNPARRENQPRVNDPFLMFDDFFGHISLNDPFTDQSGELEPMRLLENTRLSVAMVARRVGYRYESHFSRTFTQHVGCPPTRYRERKSVNATRHGRRTVRR